MVLIVCWGKTNEYIITSCDKHYPCQTSNSNSSYQNWILCFSLVPCPTFSISANGTSYLGQIFTRYLGQKPWSGPWSNYFLYPSQDCILAQPSKSILYPTSPCQSQDNSTIQATMVSYQEYSMHFTASTLSSEKSILHTPIRMALLGYPRNKFIPRRWKIHIHKKMLRISRNTHINGKMSWIRDLIFTQDSNIPQVIYTFNVIFCRNGEFVLRFIGNYMEPQNAKCNWKRTKLKDSHVLI